MKIILASQSPRRRELLTKMGITDFKVIPSDFNEQLDDSRSAEEVAIELALGKALKVAEQYPDSLVIGSDTIVTINGKQLEKPHDLIEAHEMLKLLSGKMNEVSTGLAVIRLADDIKFVAADTAKVYFRPYDQVAVETYVASGDALDKAGGYGLQSGAASLVDHMEGHYDTIIGLPTHHLADFLAQLGIQAEPVEITPPVLQI